MPGSIAIDTRKYSIYVRMITGEGDGPLLWIDSSNHIHHGPDPRPLDQAGLAALKQIETGLESLNHALAGRQKSAIGA